MTSETDDTWTQTLTTVTPEDDATLREISDTATLSGTEHLQITFDPDQIVYRRSVSDRQYVSTTETEEEIRSELIEEVREEYREEVEEETEQKGSKQDAENQTYLQGTQTVYISMEYQDEASQTLYMSTPCPPLKYFKDIMTSMHKVPLPRLKRSNVTATIISIDPESSHNNAMDQLIVDVVEQELEEFECGLGLEEETEMEMIEILQFILERAFWIHDPGSQGEIETADEEAQTMIRYNNHAKIFVVDSHIQTELSCEPKQSNTMLLMKYWETKNMVLNCLEECISKGIETKIVVDDIIDEILDKCAERIRYPMKEQIIQTIATYKLDVEKEEDVMRKLKLEIVVDPLEASIIVVPLMDDLLQLVCDAVTKNSAKGAKYVLNAVLQRTMNIVTKLIELQQERKHKPIDQILAKRKQKILESMSKKETDTISTQTSIAAISEVKKIKKSKEVLCSICRRPSRCRWCSSVEGMQDVPKEETKILRTQDILLAYKPCYIVTKVSKSDEHLQPPCPPEKKITPPKKLQPCLSKHSTGDYDNTICIFLQDKKIEPQESFNEWSYVTDATIMKPCSLKESVSSSSQTTITLLHQSICEPSFKHQSTLTTEAVNALQVLKDTFCTRENCITSSLQTLKSTLAKNEGCTRSTCNAYMSINNTDNKMFKPEIIHTQQTSKTFSKLHLPNISTHSTCSQIPNKSYGDGFKIIPVYLSQDSYT